MYVQWSLSSSVATVGTGIKLDPSSLASMDIWVTFPGLDLQFRLETMLGRIASYVGRPRYTNKLTTIRGRLSYVRVLVEVDVTWELRWELQLRGSDGSEFVQPNHYD